MPRYAYPAGNLPEPQAISTLDAETLLAAIKVLFSDIAATHDLDVSGIIDLEGEPANIQLQVQAYREVILRAAINDAVKANLLAFAADADLDHLAAFYDAERLDGETDPAFRARVILAIRGRSPAGGEAHYENAARRADVRVADVAVFRKGNGPAVTVSVLATDNGGLADQPLLDAVAAELNLPTVKVVSDTIVVEAAVKVTQAVAANIWLLPDAPESLIATLGASLDDAAEREGGLGFDLTRSWLVSKLHVAGVQKVEIVTPVADVIVDGSSAVAIGSKTFVFMGRAR